MTSSATIRRLQVLDLRIRLELLGAKAFDEVCRPVLAGRQSEVGKRLIFLVGLFVAARQPEVYRLARLGGYVYRRTSDVRHGRVNALDLSDVVVDEWRTIVENMEQLLAEGMTP